MKGFSRLGESREDHCVVLLETQRAGVKDFQKNKNIYYCGREKERVQGFLCSRKRTIQLHGDKCICITKNNKDKKNECNQILLDTDYISVIQV